MVGSWQFSQAVKDLAERFSCANYAETPRHEIRPHVRFSFGIFGGTEMNSVQSLHSFIPQLSMCYVTGNVWVYRNKYQVDSGFRDTMV